MNEVENGDEKKQVEDLLSDLGVDISLADDQIFRVGKNMCKCRPLIVKLNMPEIKSKIMFLAKNLKNNVKWKGVSITHDLTKLQCQEEKLREIELRRRANEKNCHSLDKGMIWKVVGGRGARHLALRSVLLDCPLTLSR